MAYTMSHDTASEAAEGTSRIRQMRARDSSTVAIVWIYVAYRRLQADYWTIWHAQHLLGNLYLGRSFA